MYWDHEPTPTPPKRGAVLAGQFPSWEGSGVGWSATCPRRAGRQWNAGESDFPLPVLNGDDFDDAKPPVAALAESRHAERRLIKSVHSGVIARFIRFILTLSPFQASHKLRDATALICLGRAESLDREPSRFAAGC